MSTLTDAVRADLTAAMRARDEDTKRTLRSLLAAIQTEAVSGAKHEVGDEDVLRLIAREIKKRRESAEIYREAGREELAAAEETEADILARYQPAQLDDADLAAVVDGAVAEVSAKAAPVKARAATVVVASSFFMVPVPFQPGFRPVGG